MTHLAIAIVASGLALVPRPALSQLSPRDLEVIGFAAAGAASLHHTPLARLSAYSCTPPPSRCRAVRLQVDERDAGYNWVLDAGPAATHDEPPEVLDDNDLLLLRAQDAGACGTGDSLPPHQRAVELTLFDPLVSSLACLYLVVTAEPTKPGLPPLVTYDPARGRFRGSSVELGFGADVPEFLALTAGGGGAENLLDRLKVRARVELLWGLLTFTRDESDLTTEVVAWRNGPLRAIRRQRQRVRLGWGIRSPAFVSETFFYPDAAEMPVRLRLAHPPAYLFGDIRIEAWLDFRDLSGWQLQLADGQTRQLRPSDAPWSIESEGEWFALSGPERTLLQQFAVGPSLATTRRRIVARVDPQARPPESVSGEAPGVGYRLEGWEGIDAGTHHLTAFSYALPRGVSPAAMRQDLATPIVVHARALPAPPATSSPQGR